MSPATEHRNITNPVDTEQEQLLRMDCMRRLLQLLLRRHIVLLILLFVLLLLSGATLAVCRNRTSPKRFTAELELLFQPKASEYIQSIDDTAMLHLFSRNLIFRRVEEELRTAGYAAGGTGITITQKRNQRHLFTINAYGNTAEEAAAKANAAARICREEYRNFRLADLANWTDIVQQQHSGLVEKIHRTAEEMVTLAQDVGLTDLESEQARLRKIISDQEHALSSLNIRLADAVSRREKITAALQRINPRALVLSGKIRDRLKTIQEIDDALLIEAQLYTDSNPKLLALKARRQAAQANYESFLRNEGLAGFDPDNLNLADRLKKESEEVLSDEQTISSNLRVLKEELTRNTALLQKLTAQLPRLNQLKLLQDANLKNLETAENRLTDLNYLKISADNELQPLETANQAKRQSAFTRTTVAAMLFMAVFATAAAAGVLVILQLAIGRLRNYAELECYWRLTPLGCLPERSGAYTGRAREGAYALGEIHYHFHELFPEARRIFIGSLCGGDLPQGLGDALIRLCAANGKRLLILKIVPAANFEEPAGATQLNVLAYSGNSGFFPVENPYSLSGAELNLLDSDLHELQKSFDAVVITRRRDLTRHGILYRQMLNFCDAALILVKPHRTPRAMLRQILALHHKINRELYAVMLGSNTPPPQSKD